MNNIDQDRNRNVMGYPYPSQPPNPGYSHTHQGHHNPSHENRPQSLANYPHHYPRQTLSGYPNHPQQTKSNSNYPIPTLGYPPPSTTPGNPKGYSNVASFAYYKTKVYQPLESVESGSSFARFLALLLIILVGALCVLTFIVWIFFGTQLPELYVTSLTMPNFNITGSELIAKWEANVTIKNSNEKLEISFSKGRSSIFYDNKVLALDYIEPLYLKDNEKGYLQINLSMTSKDQVHEETLKHLVEDRKNGSIIFSLRMAIEATINSNNWWRKEKLKIFCEDLMVKFDDANSVGTLTSGDDLHECLIFT